MSAELGQMLFGNKWEERDCPDFVARGLYDLSETLGRRNPDEQAHGLLGGEWGYGQEFDCPTFEMHPYWWGDCECGFDAREYEWSEAHAHADSCYRNELERERVAADLRRFDEQRGEYVGKDRSYDEDRAIEQRIFKRLTAKHGLPMLGCAVHCTCDHDPAYAKWRESNDHDARCPIVLPNFLHKPSGFAVHWYKYIGRSMTANRDIEWDEWRQLLEQCLSAISISGSERHDA